MRDKGHWGYGYGHCATTEWIMGLLHPPECHTLPPSRHNHVWWLGCYCQGFYGRSGWLSQMGIRSSPGTWLQNQS
ncbi:hypothetical protein XELAEV_18035472mg [Xenopus laevis]|uniref:Uncharacterized protein n=1 Tax=Xenopus laevis TaxID=8355 RepID=A0A974CGB3_XENLA|nr:hypothetical protein XELAEV_18035472mg [Xenopus laevis]